MKLQPEPQPDREFVDLVQRVLNHEASLDDIAHLNARLPRDSVALRYFVEMRMLHGSLEDEFGSTAGELDSIEGRLVKFPGNPGPSGATPSQAHASGKPPWRKLLVGAAALVALSLGFVGADRILHPPAFEVVARHGTGLSAVPAIGTWIRHGDTLRLKDNAVEIRSKDGNTLTFQGPGELTIQSRERLILESGRLWADLEGDPVKILTPRGEVTDLGTVFGLDASKRDFTRVDVFDGKIRFRDAGNASAVEDAMQGESLTSQGRVWNPERGQADASRYKTGIRQPIGFTFVSDHFEAEHIASSLPFRSKWATADAPSGSMQLLDTPVQIAWAGSALYVVGDHESPEEKVFHTHLLGQPWSMEEHQGRAAEAKALGLPYEEVGIVIRLRHLEAWRKSIGAKAFRVMILRNSARPDVRFYPIEARCAQSGMTLTTLEDRKSDHQPGGTSHADGSSVTRVLKRFDRNFTVDALYLLVEPESDENGRSNISGLILEPVF